MANAYLRRVSASRCLKLELEPIEVEILVVPPDEEGEIILDELSDEVKEQEAKRLRFLKWLVPKKGVARDRFEAAKVAGKKEQAMRNKPPAPLPAGMIGLGSRWQGLQQFLKKQNVGDAIAGGRDVGIDNGHGYAKLLRADAVATLATALEGVDQPPDPVLVGAVIRLAAFYRDAADAGEGVLFYIV